MTYSKHILIVLLGIFFTGVTHAQYDYEASEKHPFGLPNPEAPEQIKDFEPLIGTCNCSSTTRKQDGSWNAPEDMTWTWKYILNGTAVQDETLKSDGAHSGSIRQFIKDSSRWYVHWYASKTPSTTFPVWEGNKKDGKIVLYREQKAPNGTEGFFRLSFYDIDKTGYKWIGEWVDKTESVVYPTWKIDCKKRMDISHIEGKWKIENKDSYEVWEKKSENSYTGYGYKLKDGKEIISEHLSITINSDSILYTATVLNQNDQKPIEFTLNPAINDAYSFENLNHDFPKKIIYKIENKNTISIRVLGDNGKGFGYKLLKID
ncbi:DUF6265 family protein [Psychroserpens sp. SPM9]|uniref:DUF6265 family protein n=1 Tax=Psychroserpens sp. SPM9 TaxID=2975598 RepID=UPI0021A946D9|nr:DUF6265 family protein [Psychroserpens sp. SPM9]MDG5493101.1 DUF6265 family protein [Psychroserpens sp. SPM9]